MDDITAFPDAWRETLAGLPRAAVFAAIAAGAFVLLLALAKRPRAVLRWTAGVTALVLGAVAGIGGTRMGGWAERNDRRTITIAVAGILLIAVFALRTIRGARKSGSDRKLVDGVSDDPQRLVVLALAPELSVRARLRAVNLLDDAFSLDGVVRRARTEKVKKAAKRRLDDLRDREGTRTDGASRRDRQNARGKTREKLDRNAADVDPEDYFLPPETN